MERGLLIGAGLLLIVLGVLSHLGRLPRNRIAGMRTRATLASDEAWFASHRASAWSMVLAGGITVAAGFVDDRFLLSYAVLVVAIAIVGGIQADRVARRIAQPD